MKKMLQIIHTSENGGAEKHTRLITKAFASLGFDVIIAYPSGPYVRQYETLKNNNVECIEYDSTQNLLKIVKFIRSIIKSRDIKLIHSHMYGGDFIATLARLGLPNVKQFSTVHFLPQDNDGFLWRAKGFLMTLFAFQLASKVFAVSEPVAERARKEFWLPKNRVMSVINSIDFSEMVINDVSALKLKEKLKPNLEDRIILCIGSFVERKGQRFLIEALSKLNNTTETVKLILLGEGENEQELRKLAKNLGLKDRVIFPGYQDNIADWLSIADVYCQPSLVDPLPRAMLEAMYLRLPLIATNITSMAEAVINNDTALTIEPGSSDDAARAIETVLCDKETADRLGKSAQNFVKENCSMEGMAKKILYHLRE